MKRKHRWDPVEKKWVDVTDWKPAPRKAPFIKTDIEPFISPVDGTVISSGRQLREHNLRNDVVDTREYGNELGCDRDAYNERIARIQGTSVKEKKKRTQDIVDSIDKLEAGHSPEPLQDQEL